MTTPKYSKGQQVKILHDWARGIGPKIIAGVIWDEGWNCWTYAFDGALIRIEEEDLAPVEAGTSSGPIGANQ